MEYSAFYCTEMWLLDCCFESFNIKVIKNALFLFQTCFHSLKQWYVYDPVECRHFLNYEMFCKQPVKLNNMMVTITTWNNLLHPPSTVVTILQIGFLGSLYFINVFYCILWDMIPAQCGSHPVGAILFFFKLLEIGNF